MKHKAGIFHFLECGLETRVIVLSDFTPQEAGRESLCRRENGQRAGEEEGGAQKHPPWLAFVLWPTCPCPAEQGCVRHTGRWTGTLGREGPSVLCFPRANLRKPTLCAHGLNQALRVTIRVF